MKKMKFTGEKWTKIGHWMNFWRNWWFYMG